MGEAQLSGCGGRGRVFQVVGLVHDQVEVARLERGTSGQQGVVQDGDMGGVETGQGPPVEVQFVESAADRAGPGVDAQLPSQQAQGSQTPFDRSRAQVRPVARRCLRNPGTQDG